MADSTIKPDSGNDLVLQNNGGSKKIEITDSGNIEVTGAVAVDDIVEKTSAHGVEIDGVLVKDGGVTAKSTLSTNLTQANFYSNGGGLDENTTSDFYFLRYWDESTDYRGARLRVKNEGYSNKGGEISIQTSKNGTANQWNSGLTVKKDGDVVVEDGDLVIGTAGHGIDFSASNPSLLHSATSESEVLTEYERGYLDFPLKMYTGGSWQECKNAVSNTTIRLYYEKIGNIVNIVFQGDFNPPNSVNGGGGTDLSGLTRLYLPFEISKNLTGFSASNSEQVVYFTSAINSSWSSSSWGFKLVPGNDGAYMSNGGLSNYSHVAGQRLTINARFTYFSN